ncbi:hypothetical protein V6Z12_A07G177900 [Gossypium hirsutum]
MFLFLLLDASSDIYVWEDILFLLYFIPVGLNDFFLLDFLSLKNYRGILYFLYEFGFGFSGIVSYLGFLYPGSLYSGFFYSVFLLSLFHNLSIMTHVRSAFFSS